MNKERYDILEQSGLGLTKEEYDQGWHWCNEWDGLLVGPSMREAIVCSCNHPVIEAWKETEEAKEMINEMSLDKPLETDYNTPMSNDETIFRTRSEILTNALKDRDDQLEKCGQTIFELRKERDEARRMYCELYAVMHGRTPSYVANSLDWDCVKEDSDAEESH